MSCLITEQYRALNAELHSQGIYGVSGGRWAKDVYRVAREIEARSVLDYGCGQGRLFMSMDNLPWPLLFDRREYDPAIPGKDVRPEPADLVVCGDVLEHIEPECLYAVMSDLRDLAKRAVFLVVATRPAKKVLADGRNAHLIVEPASWWLPKIMDRWRVKAFQDFGGEFVCIGETK
jgi:2-polyprenyl-3-methyl-5-hydroxy-6-metoxy-1,4-benzoquinol methylase